MHKAFFAVSLIFTSQLAVVKNSSTPVQCFCPSRKLKMSPVHVNCESAGPVGAFKSVRSARTLPLVRILTPRYNTGNRKNITYSCD